MASELHLGDSNWTFFQVGYPVDTPTKLARIRSGWPGQVLTKLLWSGRKSVCKYHRARFWQNATGPLQVSYFQTRLRSSTDGHDQIVQGQLGSNCARPAGIKLCKASWDQIVQGQLGSNCARPAGIKLCKASWDQIVQGQLGSDLVLVDL